MPVPNWSAVGRSVLRFLVDRLLRALLTLGSIATGVASTGWWQARGEHWWEGAAPLKGSGPRSVIVAARAEPGALDDPGVLREMRSLRGSQDLPRLCERAEKYADAAPHWHPERRPAGGGS
jgi:hypothetical protein